MLKIRDGRREFSKLEFAESAPVERIRRIRTSRNRPVVAIASFLVLAIFKIEVGEFLVVSRRGIVENQRFQPADAAAAREDLEAAAEHPDFGQHLHTDVDESAKPAAK